METGNENTKIRTADLSGIKNDLLENKAPITLDELTKKLAFKKNASQLSQEVKIYDQNAQYEIGDLILKPYDEPLLVSSKGTEHFKGDVVLKVVGKIKYESFHCEMLEVDFTGGGVFRKHIDFMKRNKTQVLLPANMDNRGQKPEILNKKEDPRLNELPMTEKDLKTLERNLLAELSRSDEFYHWNNFWQLSANRIPVSGSQVKAIESRILKDETSISAEDIAVHFLKIKKDSPDMALACLSLNYILETEYKKTFVFVSPEEWGRWHLRKILEARLKNLPLTAKKVKVPAFDDSVKEEISLAAKFPYKAYLSWREILSGGLKTPKSLNRELAKSREYILIDSEDGTKYPVLYYPNSHIFLGLKEFYKKKGITQGTSLTLKHKAANQYHISLKKSKKSISVPAVTYDSKKDLFVLEKKEASTTCAPNKILFLETETLKKILPFQESKKKSDLRELLILVFKNFGIESETLYLHYLRAFHLVDMIRQTTMEDIERTLLNAPEFAKSETKKGIFIYVEKVKSEEDLPLEEEEEELADDLPTEEPDLASAKGFHAEIGMTEDEAQEAGEEKEEAPLVEVIAEAPPEPVPAEEPEELPEIEIIEDLESGKEPEDTAGKEAKAGRPEDEESARSREEKKKKVRKIKPEAEKSVRRRKGGRKIREEEIEMEESEMEAFIAIKAKDKEPSGPADKKPEAAPQEKPDKKKPKKEDFTTFVSDEPKFGIFAEMLKSALSEKEKDEEKEKKETKPKKKPAASKK